jgi:drug/metabolite transporter (DMT)-like permease
MLPGKETAYAALAAGDHLVPVFGALFGVMLLGERLGLHHLAGFALILTGIAVANGLAPGGLRGAR